MAFDWRSDLSVSAQVFESEVWPLVSPLIGGGDIKMVEGSSLQKDINLDILAGIDAWQKLPDQQAIRGIASRIQAGASFRTFTIRHSRASGNQTEWEKRCLAIEKAKEGYAYPGITVQAYKDWASGKIEGCAIRTADLYRRVLDVMNAVDHDTDSLAEFFRDARRVFGVWIMPNRDGKSDFIAVGWDKLREHGVEIFEFSNDPESEA